MNKNCFGSLYYHIHGWNKYTLTSNSVGYRSITCFYLIELSVLKKLVVIY